LPRRTSTDEPGMVVEAALRAAERQQVRILDKRLLQTLERCPIRLNKAQQGMIG
jgi:hypothetical protein